MEGETPHYKESTIACKLCILPETEDFMKVETSCFRFVVWVGSGEDGDEKVE